MDRERPLYKGRRETSDEMRGLYSEYQYLASLSDILKRGSPKMSMGGGVEYVEVFGLMQRYDLTAGFPLLTTKRVPFRLITEELLWFLRGESNIKPLVDRGVHIWDDWPYRNYRKAAQTGQVPMLSQDEFIQKIRVEAPDSEFVKQWGELGPVYGAQWRSWQTPDGRKIDQIRWLVDKLRRTPERRHAVVSAWNPAYIYEMASADQRMMDLPPCHMIFQVNVQDDELSLMMFQRSADMFLGVPFNIASYALLTHMIAHATGFKAKEFIHVFGSAHIYANHFDQVNEQILRNPRPLPSLWLNPQIREIDQFTIDDIKLEGYNPHPALKGDIVVVGGMF